MSHVSVTPPHRWSPLILGLIAVTVVASLAAVIDARAGGDLYRQLALIPEDVWRGEVWRLVTWTFVETGALPLAFGCATIYVFGSDLVAAWGTSRLARYLVLVMLAAGVGTTVVSAGIEDARWYPHLAGWALGDALVIAWALEFPGRSVRLYYMIDVGGPTLAYGTLGLTVLFAVFHAVTPFLPELFAGAVALGVAAGGGARRRRASDERGLHVVPGDDEPDDFD